MKFKIILQVKEEKLKNALNKIAQKSTEKRSSSLSNLTGKKKTPTASGNLNTISNSSDDASSNLQSQNQNQSRQTSPQRKSPSSTSNDHSTDQHQTSIIQRSKNFSEIELNNVRSRLQQRLNELEPLPELLKNTELKLHEALARIKSYENEASENRKIINDLKSQLELAHIKLSNKSKEIKIPNEPKKSSSQSTLLQAEQNAKQQQAIIEKLASNKLEPVERRMQKIEEENREMLRQLGQKEELIRELTVNFYFVIKNQQNFIFFIFIRIK